MKILITGGSGFIGQALCSAFVEQGYQVGVVSRDPSKAQKRLPQTVDIRSNVSNFSDFYADGIINLTGAPIANRRWSERRKRQLIDSRVKTTEALLSLAQQWPAQPSVFISASAVGFYGDCGDTTVTEDSPQGSGFSAELCGEWEAAAKEAKRCCSQVCILRIGIVLDQPGGLLDRFVLPFKMGLGGRFGSGRQYMPWVHRSDVIRVIEWLLTHPSMSGTFNLSAPNPVTNAEFVKALGHQLHRPTVLPVPEPALKLIFGEMAELMLEGAKMVPKRLLESGFDFEYPAIEDALSSILAKK